MNFQKLIYVGNSWPNLPAQNSQQVHMPLPRSSARDISPVLTAFWPHKTCTYVPESGNEFCVCKVTKKDLLESFRFQDKYKI